MAALSVGKIILLTSPGLPKGEEGLAVRRVTSPGLPKGEEGLPDREADEADGADERMVDGFDFCDMAFDVLIDATKVQKNEETAKEKRKYFSIMIEKSA